MQEEPWMPSMLVAAISIGLSQVLLSALLLAQQRPWGVRESLFAVLLLAITAYLLEPFARQVGLGAYALGVGTLVPGMFWLFSSSIFDDHFRLQSWQVGLVAATVLLPALARLLQPFDGLDWLLLGAPQLLEFVLLGLAFWVAARFWRVDLVESRRRARLWFVGITGSYLVALLLTREILFAGEGWWSQWQYLPVGAILLAMNALLLRYRRDVFFAQSERDVTDQPESARVAQAADETLVEPLQVMMEQERIYREMGLTIGDLAQRMEVPQYRLRQTINAGLGFRNFSDFLNRYRVAEAADRLADAGEESVPVLTIAMDAGFRSLSSFNRAFKEIHGLTPTAWRKQAGT